MRGVFGHFVAALCAVMMPSIASAQFTVAGHVSLQELPGKSRHDIASALVWLIPVGVVARGTDTLPQHASIAMRGREFLPHIRVVAVGGLVDFPNQDPFSHNVFSNSELGQFDLGLYRRRETKVARFSGAGVYAVYCNIHARMASYVVAVPTRHIATVDRSGNFTLQNVPAGTYEIHGWHERASETHEKILVRADAPNIAITLDARGFVAGPHLNKFGQPYAATRADRYE